MPFSHRNAPCENGTERTRRERIVITPIPNVRFPYHFIDRLFSVRYGCGHHYSSFGYQLRVYAYGYTLPVQGTRERCPKCAMEYIHAYHCRCYECGYPILPGESTCLIPIERIENAPRDGRTAIVRMRTVACTLNCVRWDCLAIGPSGFWTGTTYKAYGTGETFPVIMG
jgi:hypothetical protein